MKFDSQITWEIRVRFDSYRFLWARLVCRFVWSSCVGARSAEDLSGLTRLRVMTGRDKNSKISECGETFTLAIHSENTHKVTGLYNCCRSPALSLGSQHRRPPSHRPELRDLFRGTHNYRYSWIYRYLHEYTAIFMNFRKIMGNPGVSWNFL
jgi:hypothetical protein